MKQITKEITKSAKLISGEKITRTGQLTMSVPETPADVVSLLGENIAAFAALGYRTYVRQNALNALVGAVDTSNLTDEQRKEQKSVARSFRAALDVMVETLGQKQEDAIAVLFAKPQFAGIKAELDALKTSDATPKVFDYSSVFPIPSLAAVEAEEEQEAE